MAVIPFEPQMFGTAANNGQMISEIAAGHRVSRDLPLAGAGPDRARRNQAPAQRLAAADPDQVAAAARAAVNGGRCVRKALRLRDRQHAAAPAAAPTLVPAQARPPRRNAPPRPLRRRRRGRRDAWRRRAMPRPVEGFGRSGTRRAEPRRPPHREPSTRSRAASSRR